MGDVWAVFQSGGGLFPSNYSMTSAVELPGVDALRTVVLEDGSGASSTPASPVAGQVPEHKVKTPLEKALELPSASVQFFLYDTPGQPYLRELAREYVDATCVLIFVYDVTSIDSFEWIREWAELLSADNALPAVGMVVANKADKSDLRAVDADLGLHFAKSLRYPFFELAAPDASAVDAAFKHLAEAYASHYQDFVSATRALAS